MSEFLAEFAQILADAEQDAPPSRAWDRLLPKICNQIAGGAPMSQRFGSPTMTMVAATRFGTGYVDFRHRVERMRGFQVGSKGKMVIC